MKIARPTVAEERWLLLADRYPALRATVDPSSTGNWKTTTALGRGLGFVLGLLAAAMLGGVLSPLPAPLLVGGLLLLVAAEWLVAQRRVFRSGVEEALYLCGAVAVAVQLLVWADGNNAAVGILLVSLAVGLAGWRLLNPLCTTLAGLGLMLAVAFVDARLLDGRLNTLAAALCSALAGAAALLASGRTWQRPSHDHMLDGLVIVMPWSAYGWLLADGARDGAPGSWDALVLALVFLAANLVAGVRRRHHAPLIAAVGGIACAAWSLHVLVPWVVHWQMILAGAVLLGVAVLLDRVLRQRERGVTARAIEDGAELDLAQLAGAVHLAPAPGVAPSPAVQGQGGEFGGGGASGRF